MPASELPIVYTPEQANTSAEQPDVNLQLEQIVKKLADAYGVDLSQPGAQLRLDMPTRPDRWMIANFAGQIVLARGFEQEDGTLSPDHDMAFAIGEVGGVEARSEPWGKRRYIPLLAGGGPDQPVETLNQEPDDEVLNVPPESVGKNRNDYVEVFKLGLNRDNDLSPDANWLCYLLLLDENDVEELRQEFEWEGRNFQAAYDELDGHGLIVRSQPGHIRLPNQWILKKKNEEKPKT